MFSIEYMHFYHQCVQQNSNNTQNTVLKKWAFAHHHIVIQREELPKIAYIPEKEYNYLSIHNFDTSHFFVGWHFYKINGFGNCLFHNNLST